MDVQDLLACLKLDVISCQKTACSSVLTWRGAEPRWGRERCLLSTGLFVTLKKISRSASESFRDKSFRSDFDCGLMGILVL